MNDSNLTYHWPLLFNELVKKQSEREMKRSEKKKKKVIDASKITNDKLTG